MEIACTYKIIEPNDPSDYCCQIDGGCFPLNIKKLIFQGEHLDGKKNDDVKELRIYSGRMTRIPQYFGIFKNIEVLIINATRLESITKYDLRPFTKLKVLNLNNNHLEFIPGDLLEFNMKIETLIMSNNRIKWIGYKLLENLPNLIFADFQSNVTVNAKFSLDDCYSYTHAQLRAGLQAKCRLPMIEMELHKIYFRALDEERALSEEFLLELEQEGGKKTKIRKSSYKEEEKNKAKTLSADVHNFVAAGDFKDFTIKIDARKFEIYKTIFAARSGFFAEFIKNNPDADSMVLEEVPEEIFECILNFVYKDEQPEVENIHEVFAAAGKLKIYSLMGVTAEKLMNQMANEEDLETLYNIMILGNKYKHDELKMKAFEGIKKHFPGRELKCELAGDLDKLKKIIYMKIMLDRQLID